MSQKFNYQNLDEEDISCRAHIFHPRNDMRTWIILTDFHNEALHVYDSDTEELTFFRPTSFDLTEASNSIVGDLFPSMLLNMFIFFYLDPKTKKASYISQSINIPWWGRFGKAKFSNSKISSSHKDEIAQKMADVIPMLEQLKF